jgi:hypothetical protein
MCLRIKFFKQQWLGAIKLIKSLYPTFYILKSSGSRVHRKNYFRGRSISYLIYFNSWFMIKKEKLEYHFCLRESLLFLVLSKGYT